MDGWKDGQTEVNQQVFTKYTLILNTDGWMDGWMDGWNDGQTEVNQQHALLRNGGIKIILCFHSPILTSLFPCILKIRRTSFGRAWHILNKIHVHVMHLFSQSGIPSGLSQFLWISSGIQFQMICKYSPIVQGYRFLQLPCPLFSLYCDI